MLSYYAFFGGTSLIIISVIQIAISIALAAWVYRDAQMRNLDATMWACIVFFCGCIGFIVYLVTRDNARTRMQAQGYYTGPQGYPQQGGNYQSNIPDYSNQGSPYNQPPPSYGVPPRPQPSPFGNEDQTSRPSALGIPPSEYGETEIHTMPPSAHNFKICKFCNSKVPEHARNCPVCGGDQFEH